MKLKIAFPEKIKLSQYQKFIRTTKDSEDVNFINKQVVGIFCNLPDNIVNNIKAKDFNLLVSDITKLINKKHQFIDRFTLNGVEYGFIPKLDDITVGEKADIDSYINDINKAQKLMGVLFRPIIYKKKDSYIIDKYVENVELDVDLDIYFGALVFFYSLMNDLLNCTQNFIAQEVEKNPALLKNLEKNGGGFKIFMQSLEETFSSLKTLNNYDYMKL